MTTSTATTRVVLHQPTAAEILASLADCERVTDAEARAVSRYLSSARDANAAGDVELATSLLRSLADRHRRALDWASELERLISTLPTACGSTTSPTAIFEAIAYAEALQDLVLHQAKQWDSSSPERAEQKRQRAAHYQAALEQLLQQLATYLHVPLAH
jgi:rubrerythrin